MSQTPIISKTGSIYFGDDVYTTLNAYLQANKPSKIIIIVDSNTHQLCWPHFIPQLETEITIETIEMDAGESYKTIETCIGIWNALSELGADRKSLIINLGGGVVTDLGGFVASTFKRGIPYINLPTSLLAMVDASVGGKTGVDLGALKNQIGIIAEAQMVLVDTKYLETLPGAELRSGHAEILKHGLISNKAYWDKAITLNNLTLDSYDALIYESVEIKNKITTQDPTEQGIRKTLNFGHTLGHAIESYKLEHTTQQTLLHGEAVAIGMVLALFISTEICNFPKDLAKKYSEQLIAIYPKTVFNDNDIESIIQLLKFDKKNSHGRINFVLLENIGKPVLDCQVPNSVILAGFNFYKNI